MSTEYHERLKQSRTAREEGALRRQVRGTEPISSFYRRDTSVDSELLSGEGIRETGDALMRRVSKPEETLSEDFINDMLQKVYENNDQLKNLMGQVPDADSKVESFLFESGQDSGIKLKQDLEEALGIDDHVAAAIAGNAAYETGDFQFFQELDPLVKGSKGGAGVLQWTGPRRVKFMEWSKENNLNPKSYEANLGFLVHEFKSDPYYQKVLMRLENTSNVNQASKIFTDSYLRPAKPNASARLNKSKFYLGK